MLATRLSTWNQEHFLRQLRFNFYFFCESFSKQLGLLSNSAIRDVARHDNDTREHEGTECQSRKNTCSKVNQKFQFPFLTLDRMFLRFSLEAAVEYPFLNR